jgi:hypothetical protein
MTPDWVAIATPADAATVTSWAAQHRCRVVATYAPTLAGLGHAVGAVRAGEAAGVVVPALPAVGDVLRQESLRAYVQQAGGVLVPIHDQDDQADGAARPLLRAFASVHADVDRRATGHRLHARRDQAKQEGRFVGGRAPYGYERLAGELVELADEQAILARIDELVEAGYGDGVIARQLRVEGYRTRGGGEWNGGTVARIRKRRRLAAQASAGTGTRAGVDTS